MKLLYVNANILYGECLKLLERRTWSRRIKTGVCDRLILKGFSLITSLLTKMEILQRLIREENCSVKSARSIYKQILLKFNVFEISSLNKNNLLTNTFMDVVAISNLDFKDALHLEIASQNRLIVVTHDKKFRKNYSLHQDKLKHYSQVVKPEELFDDEIFPVFDR